MKLGYYASTALVLSACTLGGADRNDELGSAENAVVGQDTYLYFRCNSTSWNPDDVSRLRSTVDPYVFSLMVDVKQVGYADNCIFTETNQLNGWGTTQKAWGTVHGPVNVPGGDYLSSNGAGFNVKYPAIGSYKLTVNWMQGMFQIAAATAADWEPCVGSQVTTVAQYPQSPA